MKVLSLCFSFLVLGVCGQNSVKVEYIQQNYFPADYFEKIPAEFREQSRTNMIAPSKKYLVNNGNFSICTNEDKNLNDIPEQIFLNSQSMAFSEKGAMIPRNWVLKDFNKGCNYELKNLGGKEYIVKDTVSETKFTFSNKTKLIDKYKCKLAYVLSKKNVNDTIKYWYTQEIPIIDGPFQMLDIPGLILGYEAKFKTIYVTKISFSNAKEQFFNVSKLPKVYSKKEFIDLKTKFSKSNEYIDEKGNKLNVKTYRYE